jgi:hypothetical protein
MKINRDFGRWENKPNQTQSNPIKPNQTRSGAKIPMGVLLGILKPGTNFKMA